MRRCFMTGKPCFFCSYRAGLNTPDHFDSVFVIMPYRPNLMTFYDWSLEPFLRTALGNTPATPVPAEKIIRADHVNKIGYVMCENICRKIQ